jgi:hypothetical protein
MTVMMNTTEAMPHQSTAISNDRTLVANFLCAQLFVSCVRVRLIFGTLSATFLHFRSRKLWCLEIAYAGKSSNFAAKSSNEDTPRATSVNPFLLFGLSIAFQCISINAFQSFCFNPNSPSHMSKHHVTIHK